MLKRIITIGFFFILTSISWFFLSAVMGNRDRVFQDRLTPKVAGLWGDVLTQEAPQLEFSWITEKWVTYTVGKKGVKKTKKEKVVNRRQVLFATSDVQVNLDLEHRKKGLIWYPTFYAVFSADYTYTHQGKEDGSLNIAFQFPNAHSSFDDFVFTVNSVTDPQIPVTTLNNERVVNYVVPVKPGEKVDLSLSYKTRGLYYWQYGFGRGVNRVNQFALSATTNFKAIDFQDNSMSPSEKTETANGWTLGWKFDNLISPDPISVAMPQKLNPGPLAAKMSAYAPVGLFFFYLWMFVISLLKKIDLHPVNFLFLGAAFFCFNLLFSFTVDHITVELAFIISSVVSIFLVVSYLRLVVGLRFAAVEAGFSQLVYLVLFSYAHFYQGFTGLIHTIGSILTLFLVMQLTGRINWTEKLSGNGSLNKVSKNIPEGRLVV